MFRPFFRLLWGGMRHDSVFLQIFFLLLYIVLFEIFQLCYKTSYPVDKKNTFVYDDTINRHPREKLALMLQLCYKTAEAIAIFFRL